MNEDLFEKAKLKLPSPRGVEALQPDDNGVYDAICKVLTESNLSHTQGVYVFYDCRDHALYVGQCVATKDQNGLSGRVQRHLTCGRSDNIAKRRFNSKDVYRIDFYFCDGMTDKKAMNILEGAIYHGLLAAGHDRMLNSQIPTDHPLDDVPFEFEHISRQLDRPTPCIEDYTEDRIEHLLETFRYSRGHPSKGADNNVLISFAAVLECLSHLKPNIKELFP